VATAIRWARERGRKVAARGQGHSVYGRAQVRDGLVIDMRQLRQVHVIADDHIVVGAGAT
jgi:FAD/FMN-containing dehydrogenase